MKKFIGLALILFNLSYAGSLGPGIDQEDKAWSIGPEENLGSEVTRQIFYEVIHKVHSLYVHHGHEQGRDMIIGVSDWDYPHFSAWAREEDKHFTINFWGGFARIPTMTVKGFILTACHEVGHILGGHPRVKIKDSKNMSAEGQSDYFATALCMKKYFTTYSDEIESANELNPNAASKCYEKFPNNQEQMELCLNVAKAGQDFSAVLTYVRDTDNHISYDTPSQTVVGETLFNSYPTIQCRLDTYLAGALTTYNHDGTSSEDLRPSCWFKK